MLHCENVAVTRQLKGPYGSSTTVVLRGAGLEKGDVAWQYHGICTTSSRKHKAEKQTFDFELVYDADNYCLPFGLASVVEYGCNEASRKTSRNRKSEQHSISIVAH